MICNSASGCGAPPRPSRRLSLTSVTTVIHRYARNRVTFLVSRFGEIYINTQYNVVVLLRIRTKGMFFHLCSLFLMPLVHAMISAIRDIIALTKKSGALARVLFSILGCSGGNYGQNVLASHLLASLARWGPNMKRGLCIMHMSRGVYAPGVEGLL